MYAHTTSFGHYQVVIYDPANMALLLSSSRDETEDFDSAADFLRSQGFLPASPVDSKQFLHDGRFVNISLWVRSGVPMVDELTRELGEQVARQAEAQVYREPDLARIFA